MRDSKPVEKTRHITSKSDLLKYGPERLRDFAMGYFTKGNEQPPWIALWKYGYHILGLTSLFTHSTEVRMYCLFLAEMLEGERPTATRKCLSCNGAGKDFGDTCLPCKGSGRLPC